jgi:hypothetical protein
MKARIPLSDRTAALELERARTAEVQARTRALAAELAGIDVAELEANDARARAHADALERQGADIRGRYRVQKSTTGAVNRDTFKAAIEGAPTRRLADPDTRRKLSQGEKRERSRVNARARAGRFAERLRQRGVLNADARPFDENVDELTGWAFEHPRAAIGAIYPRIAHAIVRGFVGSGRDVAYMQDRKYLTYALAIIASATATRRAGFALVSWGYSQQAIGCYMRNPYPAKGKIHGPTANYSRETIRSVRVRRDGTRYGTRAWFLDTMEAFAPGLVSQHQPNAAELAPVEVGSSGYAYNQTWISLEATEGHRKDGQWCHHPDVIAFMRGRELGPEEYARRLAEYENGPKRRELTDEQRAERAAARAVRDACDELAAELRADRDDDGGDPCSDDDWAGFELEPDPPPLLE